jgi:hypothetical protein
MPNVVLQSVFILTAVRQSGIMLSVAIQSVVLLDAIMLYVVRQSVIILSVVVLSVVAPVAARNHLSPRIYVCLHISYMSSQIVF